MEEDSIILPDGQVLVLPHNPAEVIENRSNVKKIWNLLGKYSEQSFKTTIYRLKMSGIIMLSSLLTHSTFGIFNYLHKKAHHRYARPINLGLSLITITSMASTIYHGKKASHEVQEQFKMIPYNMVTKNIVKEETLDSFLKVLPHLQNAHLKIMEFYDEVKMKMKGFKEEVMGLVNKKKIQEVV